MTLSMTGFGAGRATSAEDDITVELKSVNHKYCEIKCRLPRELSPLEFALAKRLRDRIARGAVDLVAKRTRLKSSAQVPRVDIHLAQAYARSFDEVAVAVGTGRDWRLTDILQQQGVVTLDEPPADSEGLRGLAFEALDAAVKALLDMRDVEGRTLREDLLQRIDVIARHVAVIRDAAPRAVRDFRARLEARMRDLGAAELVDPKRLAEETVLYADRSDVTEEMTRLASHLEQFKAFISSSEPSGRKLDFLVQEMLREVNTTGSKAPSQEITQAVVSIKAELERVREQVQNVE